jgi:hypothetical protein
MNEQNGGLSPEQLRAVGLFAGSKSDESDVMDRESEAVAEWLRDDAEFIAGLNRVKSYRIERLRADVRSLASDAMATLRELVSGPDVPPAVRLRASLAILEATAALKADEVGSTSAEAIRLAMERQRLFESLGG